MSNFHAENLASILNKFDCKMDQGLSAEAIEKARAQYGKNEFGTEESAFSLKALLKSLLTWRILVLALTTAILIFSFITDASQVSLYTVGIVGAALIVHIAWAWIKEYRIRSRDIYANKLTAHNIKVMRQGKFDTCTPEDIVPGDLLSFSAGDYIPADARIIESEGLMIDESALFGTEGPVQKVSIDIPDSSIPPQKQKNMAFGGTYVAAGHGFAIVVQTGKTTGNMEAASRYTAQRLSRTPVPKTRRVTCTPL